VATPPTCATCKAYEANDETHGFCHFGPPEVTFASRPGPRPPRGPRSSRPDGASSTSADGGHDETPRHRPIINETRGRGFFRQNRWKVGAPRPLHSASELIDRRPVTSGSTPLNPSSPKSSSSTNTSMTRTGLSSSIQSSRYFNDLFERSRRQFRARFDWRVTDLCASSRLRDGSRETGCRREKAKKKESWKAEEKKPGGEKGILSAKCKTALWVEQEQQSVTSGNSSSLLSFGGPRPTSCSSLPGFSAFGCSALGFTVSGNSLAAG
jgi:hypothetical protein